MGYQKYQIKTRKDKIEVLGQVLLEEGVSSYEELEDGLIFYLESGEVDESLVNSGKDLVHGKSMMEEERILKALKEKMDLNQDTITSEVFDDTAWMDAWKEYFKPFAVGNIGITPVWEKSQQTKLEIKIDPGQVFGSGTHETTKLCLIQLQDMKLEGQKVLDVGCGSGILSIAASMLGAKKVVGTEIDPEATRLSEENAKANGCRLSVFTGDIIGDLASRDRVIMEGEGGYDLVVANILEPVILLLIPGLCDYLKPGGYFLTSGIIKEKRKEVLEAMEGLGGFALKKEEDLGDWISLLFYRKK